MISHRHRAVVPFVVVALAGTVLGACSGADRNLAAPGVLSTTVTDAVGGSDEADGLDGSSVDGEAGASGATGGSSPEPSVDGSDEPPAEGSGDSPPSASTPATPVSVVDVPEVGVPGLDSADALCSAWSRFAGSFQVVAVTAAFGSGGPEQLAALEVAAAPTVAAAYADLLEHWPDELADERQLVTDDLLGPFARRLDEAFGSLVAVGADDATITTIDQAWLLGLAQRDPSTPEFVVDLPDDVWATIDDAAAVFGARLVPFGADPSLVTDVSTPLTDAYLGLSCPDQGTLSGREVPAP